MRLTENPVFMFIVTLFTGILGVHRFITGRIGTGFLYLFTGGLFGIGWLVDLISYFFDIFHVATQRHPSQNRSSSAYHCRRCGREIPFTSSSLCEYCQQEMKREYVRVSEHFSTVIDEVEGNLVHLEDYLSRFEQLSRDIDRMWEMSRDIDVVPPFQRADLQKAMNRRFTDAVNSRISMAMEKARITLDQSRLKEELTHLTEELIECKYHYTRYSDLISQVIDKTKKVIETL